MYNCPNAQDAEAADWGQQHLSEEPEEESIIATALSDAQGNAARLGCIGLWLESTDFVVMCQEGMMTELASAFDVGAHGSIRDWPAVYKNPETVFKRMFCKGGPCGQATRIKKVAAPDPSVMERISCSMYPLQSFSNARMVKAQLGYGIVKGWAIYDLLSMGVGEGYLAERYWWNTSGEEGAKGWLDGTPRPTGMKDLILAESAEEQPPRREGPLTPLQMSIAEGLLCLRWPELAVIRSAELGTPSPVALALQASLQAEVALSPFTARRLLASACTPGARLEEMSEEEDSRALMGELLELLHAFSRLSHSDEHQEKALSSLLEAKGVETLVGLMALPDTQVAATAASALACACHENPRVQMEALGAGAPLGLARFFQREDVQNVGSYAVEAVHAVWWAARELVQQRREVVPEMKKATRSREHWEQFLQLCNGDLREEHKGQAPRTRRGHSWGRTLAFAQVALGAHGVEVRRGTVDQPFVIWVLGCEDGVEGSLAQEGFFADANWVELAPTQVVLFGEGLRDLGPGKAPCQGGPTVVRSASYEEISYLSHFGMPPPDLVAVLMPSVEVAGAPKAKGFLPESVVAAIADLPVVVSRRYGLDQDDDLNYRRKLEKKLLLRHIRCPFSTSGSTATAAFDDNGWIFAVQGDALEKALELQAVPEVVLPFRGASGRSKQPVVFWGILDIKYDTARPVLDRVKILETGDGQTSKFSHDGEHIKNRFEAKYLLADKNTATRDLDMQHVISADKKLTHDLVEQAAFGHLVPQQVCFPRQYSPDLASRIQAALKLEEEDKVVLKLCNRTRAAGVVVTPVGELDDVLEDLLQTPEPLATWFEERLCKIMDVEGSPVDLGLGSSYSFEEQRRHWWSNESPVFVAETWCKSVPTSKDGHRFDGTMRVGFALREGGKQSEESGELALELDWLGGYWKLPKSDIDSGAGSLREIVVSMAKAAGTAPVDPAQLLEVFSALDDVVQKLYGRSEPSSAELAAEYQEQPDLAAFLISRLATTTMNKRPAFTRAMLDDAEGLLCPSQRSPGQLSVQAFIVRSRALVEILQSGPDDNRADELLEESLQLLPTSANALHLIGLRSIIRGRPQDAVKPLTKSLLLDPDYKGVYVNLGLAYLRLKSWERCAQVSEVGHQRHPTSPHLCYHLAVSYCQMALAILQEAAENTLEMAQLRAGTEAREQERARLQESLQQADEEVTMRKEEETAAREELNKAKNEETAEKEALKRRPIAAGMKLKAAESIAVFASVDSENEVRSLPSGQVLTAAGPEQRVGLYTWVPVEPYGVVDRTSLQALPDPSFSEKVDEASRRKTAAFNRTTDCTKKRQAAKRALEEAAPVKASIAMRPAEDLLDTGQLEKYEAWRLRSIEAFEMARENELSRNRRRGAQVPWLAVDDAMLAAMQEAQGPVTIELPLTLGWQSAQYRT